MMRGRDSTLSELARALAAPDERLGEELERLRLAKQLGLEVVAEGIEDEAALGTVADMGCQYAQGYYIARPLPQASIVDWLSNHKRRP